MDAFEIYVAAAMRLQAANRRSAVLDTLASISGAFATNRKPLDEYIAAVLKLGDVDE